ncbi:MAG: phosphorylase family protein, partial [Thermoguttaceae bacterium]
MSGPAIKPCDFGIVFALGIESGALEDLLSGSVRVRAHGFTAKEGGINGRRVVIVRSGAEAKNVARATDLLLDGHHPKMVVSAGFAGGLDPKLRRNDIVVANEVIDARGQKLSLDQQASTFTWATEQPGTHAGKLLTLDQVVHDPREKQLLFQRHQAMALDMESFAVAEACRRRHVPFLGVRIILDAASDALPSYVERLLRQKSEAARLGAAVAMLWHRPKSFKDLWALKEKSLEASDRL